MKFETFMDKEKTRERITSSEGSESAFKRVSNMSFRKFKTC